MIGFRSSALLSVVLLTASGCGARDHHTLRTPIHANRAELRFVPASPELRAECRATARIVGYAVPCPTRVPAIVLAAHNPMRLAATGGAGPTGCALEIIGPGGLDGCAKSWRGWVVGSSEVGDQHLVITASPIPLRNFAKVVNGPAWYPRARVRPLGWTTINGRRMRSVYVPPATNDGSAFSRHVVLIWTVRGHTYGIGFHNVHGIRETLSLDVALARRIKLVAG